MNKTRKNKYLRKNRRISKKNKNKNKKTRKVQSGGEVNEGGEPGNTAVHGIKNPLALGNAQAISPAERVLSDTPGQHVQTRKTLTNEEFKKKTR